MWRYKINVMAELKKRGYTAAELKRCKLLSDVTMQRLRHGENITIETLNTICLLLRLQPSDVLEIYATDEEKLRYF